MKSGRGQTLEQGRAAHRLLAASCAVRCRVLVATRAAPPTDRAAGTRACRLANGTRALERARRARASVRVDRLRLRRSS